MPTVTDTTIKPGDAIWYTSKEQGDLPGKVKKVHAPNKVEIDIREGCIKIDKIQTRVLDAEGSDNDSSKRKSLASGNESGQKRDAEESDSKCKSMASGSESGQKRDAEGSDNDSSKRNSLASGSESGQKRDLPASGSAVEAVPPAKRQHAIQPDAATSAVGAQSAAALPAPSAEFPQRSKASDVGSGDEGEGGSSLTQFLKEAKAWLKAEVIDVAKRSSPPRSIPSTLAALFPPNSDTKKQIVARIPWKTQNGYVTFLRPPTNNCKGQMHVSMLSYDESSFAGQGVYLEDALLLLDNWHSWSDSVICVRPKGVGVCNEPFGWVCDGAIINATRGFAMIAVAFFAAASGRWHGEVPSEVEEVLSNIKAKYIKFSNAQSRVVAGLVDSAINSKTNRSIEDPIFLAYELQRFCLGTASGVKTALQMYKTRLMANPALQMKDSTEHCALRFMSPEKVSPGVVAKISESTSASTWQQ